MARKVGRGVCSIEGCGGVCFGRGYCNLHYERIIRFPGRKPRPSWEERFWERVDKTGDCWLWTWVINARDYGVFNVGNTTTAAHRYAWTITRGPIPEGLEIDHLCRVRTCVNPDHLEPVTHRINGLRGTSPIAANAIKTHCPQGHPYDEANTYTNPRTHGRYCRECMRRHHRQSARRAQMRAKSAVEKCT